MGNQLADRVRNEIRARIIRCDYPPGTRLTDERIILDLTKGTRPPIDRLTSHIPAIPVVSRPEEDPPFDKLSSAPVREAIIALEGEQLVKVIPRVGTVVVQITEEEALQLFRNRWALEEFVVSQLASMREGTFNLSACERANKNLESLADKFTSSPKAYVDDDTKKDVILEDKAFHAELAIAAGYPMLAERLDNLRNRISAFNQGRMKLTGEHIRQYVEEHKAILNTLQKRGEDGKVQSEYRPDVTAARNALRIHLKRSAARWSLGSTHVTQGKRDWDAIFDLPEFPQDEEQENENKKLRFDLLAARVAIELVALKRLASNPSVRLDAPEKLNGEMEMLADAYRAATSEDDRRHIVIRFCNADIGFHVALMFLTGLQFAEEAVVHFWQRFYEPARDTQTDSHMNEVVEEHKHLLDAIRPSLRLPGNAEVVAETYLTHILSALSTTATSFEDEGDERPIHERFNQLGESLHAGWWKKGEKLWREKTPKLRSETKLKK